MYAFIGVDPQALPDFDDQQFALDLLEQKHVLVAPGVSFNVPYRNHFRVTTLPDAATLRVVFARIEELLAAQVCGEQCPPRTRRLVEAQARFQVTSKITSINSLICLSLLSELLEHLKSGGTLVVPSRQRAAAVRVAYSAAMLAPAFGSGTAPDVLPWSAWVERELDAARARGETAAAAPVGDRGMAAVA